MKKLIIFFVFIPLINIAQDNRGYIVEIGDFAPKFTTTTNNDNVELFSFSVYPNPAKDQITISTNATNIKVNIFTLTGQKIITTTSKTIETTTLAKGCYIIEVNSDNIIKRKKLIIK